MRIESLIPKTDEIIKQALLDIEDATAILRGSFDILQEIRDNTSLAVSGTVRMETLIVSIQNIETYFQLEHMFAPSLIATFLAVGELGSAINTIDHLANTISAMSHLGDFELEVALSYIRIGVEAYRASEMITYLTALLHTEANRLNEQI